MLKTARPTSLAGEPGLSNVKGAPFRAQQVVGGVSLPAFSSSVAGEVPRLSGQRREAR